MSRFVTPHFKWTEFTDSDAAVEHDIENIPDSYAKANIVRTARILECVREDFGKPLRISSGYRCKELNDIVPGASDESYHLEGRAVDILIGGLNDKEVAELVDSLNEYKPVEIYQKGNSYVHVAY